MKIKGVLAAMLLAFPCTCLSAQDIWSASEWISAVDAPVVTGTNKLAAADGASWFVADVKNDKEVSEAIWHTTGLGVYDIWLNGKLVGEEVLRPGFTHYAKTKLSYSYDVTELISKDKGAVNTLAAQVTPGWWADKIVTPGGVDGMRGKKCAFRSVLELKFSDGTTALVGTDTKNWKAGIAGPVKHAAIFDGETYDARELPGFETPGKLKKPELNTEFSGEIVPAGGHGIYHRTDLALPPVKAYVWDEVTGAVASDTKEEVEYGTIVVKKQFTPGAVMTVEPGEHLVIDFGQNAAAVPAFIFRAAEGTVLTCLPGEVLNDGNGAERRNMDGPEGSLHRRNLRDGERGLWFRLSYTFAGKGFESFCPRATFFGYRYVSITATGHVDIFSVLSIPVTSITAEMEIGRMTTGNPLINRLISNTLWGQRSNYLSVPTDCPQRDERLGWTADTQVFSETGTFFANTSGFFHKWMRDMRDTQAPSGGFPGVAPSAQYGDGADCMMRLGWSDAGIIVPWTIWKQFDDTSIIDENWEAMDRFMQHVNDTRYDHNANVSENGNYQWADWVSQEALESCTGKAFVTPETKADAIVYWSFLGACYWALDADKMADMAAATGRDAASYRAMADAARKYLKENFVNPDGSFKLEVLNTMQTPALFALKNGLWEGEGLEAAKTRLRENFAAHDGCLQTGFLGTSILMSTLTENGMADLAWDVLFQRGFPSWLYSVDNGATTIWERWNSYTVTSGMGPNSMNSFNHYAYGCVCQWIWQTAAGIAADPSAPGFKHIIMKPVPDRRLGHMEAEYASAAGLIQSAWRYDGDLWIWDFTVPDGATATVTLPGENVSEEYEAGTYRIELNL